jgi:glycosyltransferase involved in cell wall biosynthesis
MRILICASEAPLPPTNGFRLLLSALVAELRLRHDVRVLALRSADQQPSPEDRDWLRLVERPAQSALADARALVSAVARRRPLSADAVADVLEAPLLQELEGFRPDVVHVTSGRIGRLGGLLGGRPSVLAALDAWHLNVEARARVASAIRGRLLRGEAGRVRRFERAEYGRFGRTVVVSEADADALRAVVPGLAVTVVPNGVDGSRYAPDPRVERDERRIVFTGVMSYAPNVLAAEFLARRVFPLVRAACPDATLALVGRKPASRVSALAELDGVEVTGEVPDVVPWLTGSRVYACPMVSGTGIKNKLLEAMAAGAPSAATPLALQGIAAQPGRDVLIGADERELAAHLIRVLADDDLAARLGRSAREFVLAHHDWAAVARAYEAVYADVTAPRPAAVTVT